MRRQFVLTSQDATFLETEVSSWETVLDGSAMWVLIHDYSLPEGYAPEIVSMAISIPTNYPDAGLDMAYFHPPVKRADGKQIPATEYLQQIDGMGYQRWSRHYTAQNPWKQGEHCLETHFHTARTWLEREIRKPS